MAPLPKPDYKLTIKLSGARAERIAEAMTTLREQAGTYTLTHEASATLTLESFREAGLASVMDDFEAWLAEHAPGLDCEMTLKRPGVRPETIARRAREQCETPMDDAGWEGDEEGDEEEAVRYRLSAGDKRHGA